MICQPTRSQLQALVNISRLPDWKGVAEILDQELALTTDRLIGAQDADATRKYQGRAKMLRDLKLLVADAPDLLVKAKA